jgi:hypothetical protein
MNPKIKIKVTIIPIKRFIFCGSNQLSSSKAKTEELKLNMITRRRIK